MASSALEIRCGEGVKQAEPLDLSRSSAYCQLLLVSERDLRLMRRLDELDLEAPYYGARKARQAAAPGGTQGRSPARAHAHVAHGDRGVVPPQPRTQHPVLRDRHPP